MAWTYQKRIQRACLSLCNKNLLADEQIANLKRPLFFGRFAFGLGISPASWSEYDSVRDRILTGLSEYDCHVVPNKATMDFYVFSSDVSVLKWLESKSSWFIFNHLRLVDESCWNIPLPKPKIKTKFYNLYGWRIQFKDHGWIVNQDGNEFLANLNGIHKVSVLPKFYNKPQVYLYLDNKNDVLLAKLLASDHILSISDRSTL